MVSSTLVVDLLDKSWGEFRLKHGDNIDANLGNWYLDRVEELLLLLKHDLDVIAEKGLLDSDSPEYICQFKYRSTGICSLLQVASDWFNLNNSKKEIDIVTILKLETLHVRLKDTLKRHWISSGRDKTYPIYVFTGGSTAINQYQTFVTAVRHDVDDWPYISKYAKMRSELITESIDIMKRCQNQITGCLRDFAEITLAC